MEVIARKKKKTWLVICSIISLPVFVAILWISFTFISDIFNQYKNEEIIRVTVFIFVIPILTGIAMMCCAPFLALYGALIAHLCRPKNVIVLDNGTLVLNKAEKIPLRELDTVWRDRKKVMLYFKKGYTRALRVENAKAACDRLTELINQRDNETTA